MFSKTSRTGNGLFTGLCAVPIRATGRYGVSGKNQTGLMRYFSFVLPLLLAATHVYPGDAFYREGSGHLLTLLWLLAATFSLLMLFLPGAPAASKTPSGTGKTSPPRRKERRSVKSNRDSRPPSDENREEAAQTERPAVPDFGLIDVLFFLFLLFYLLVSFLAQGPSHLFFTVNNTSVWLAAGGAWILFRRTSFDYSTVRGLLYLFLALSLTQSFFAVYQYSIDIPSVVASYEAAPEKMLKAMGIAPEPDNAERMLFESRLRTATPSGTFVLTNTLGGELALGVVLGLSLLWPRWRTRQRSSRAVFHRILPWVLVTSTLSILLWTLLLTECRSAFLALGAGLLLYGFLEWRIDRQRFVFSEISSSTLRDSGGSSVSSGRNCRKPLLILLLSMVPAIGLLWFLRGPLWIGARRSLAFRFEYWETTLRMIADHPFFGCGIGNFQQTYMRYKSATASEEIVDPHNFIMELAACGGLPTLLLFLLFLLGIVCFLRDSLSCAVTVEKPSDRSSRDKKTWAFLSAGWLGVLLGLLVTGGSPVDFIVPVFVSTLAFVFTACLAHLVSGFEEKANASMDSRSLSSICAAVLATQLLHLSAAGGISYINVLLPLLFFAAVPVNRYPTVRRLTLSQPRSRCLGKGLAICGFLLIFFLYAIVYLPSVTARGAMHKSLETSDPFTRAEILENVPFLFFPSPEYQQTLIEARLQCLIREPNNALLKMKLEEAVERTYRTTGGLPSMLLYLAATLETAEGLFFREEDKRPIRERLLKYTAEAVRTYPNSALIHAARARSLDRYGGGERRDEMRMECETALRLDRLTPHSDKKLPKKTRIELERLSTCAENH